MKYVATSISDALAFAQSQGVPRLDAQMLLLHALGRAVADRAWLLAHDTDPLAAAQKDAWQTNLQRHQHGEPVAYITGHKEFFGLDLQVDARVLVPRPDTETLVQWALEVLQTRPATRVLDLGTGSGAIALAIKHTAPRTQMHARDVSACALEVARANARQWGLDIQFSEGSWFEGLDETFDVVVSNPPYIADQDHHLDALRHEPLSALTSGPDGLHDLRHIVAQSGSHLRPRGWLLLEHGHDQAAAVCALLEQAGFEQVQSRADLSGKQRCSGGRWPDPGSHALHRVDL